MKPILFNTEMVKAILDGRKTQTRRVINGFNNETNHRVVRRMVETKNIKQNYQVDDVLYIRETFRPYSNITMDKEVGIHYKADDETIIYPDEDMRYYAFDEKWKPSIHMPKKYARIFLKVTDVRVERLQDITNLDIQQEGFLLHDSNSAFTKENYHICIEDRVLAKWWQDLWNSTSKDGYKWEDNPYVFVYEFERVEKPDA